MSAAQNGVSKTQMVYKANLNFAFVGPYIAKLLEKGLLRLGSDEEESAVYTLTVKGQNLLRSLAMIERELEGLSHSSLDVEILQSDMAL